MSNFYSLPKATQWVLSILLLIGCLGFGLPWLDYLDQPLIFILLIFVIVPIFQFLTTPFMTLTGVYTYLSPMLLVYSARPERYDLHNGTSFDYIHHYRNTKAGMKWQNQLLLYFMDGLLEIIRRIESGELPETVEVRGSSYFLSDQTIERLGFKSKKTGIAEKFNIIVNYLDLVWMYSLSKGKLSFPNLANIKTITTKGQQLVQQKDQFLKMKTFLEKR
ncbi:MAG: hypothetical protein AAGC47_13565 [Bacteroidota bacterium]